MKRIAFISIFVFLASALAADTLELRNGRKLTGRVVRQTPTTIFFQGSDGKTATYPKSAVRRIRYGAVPDPAEERRKLEQKREAERKRREALRKKQEAARRAAAERRRKAAEARRKEQERIAREKREEAAREEAARLRKKQEEARQAQEARSREEAAAERRRAAAEAEKRERQAEEKRQRAEEERLLKEVEKATAPLEEQEPAAQKPQKAEQPAAAVKKSEPPPERDARTDVPVTDAWILEAGLALGSWDPDLERRIQADRIYNSLVNAGGIGFNSAWRDKGFGALPLGLRYERDRLHFAARFVSTTVRPSWIGLFSADGVQVGPLNSDLFEIEAVQADRLTREQWQWLAGYEVYRSEPFSLYLSGGLQSLAYEGDLSSRKYVGSRASADLPAFGARLNAQGHELSTGTGTYRAEAGGSLLGIRGRYRFGEKWEVDLGAQQYNLAGTTRLITTDTKISTVRSTVSIPGVFKADGRSQKGGIEYREENGTLAVTGRQFDTSLAYIYSERTKLIFRFTRLVSDMTDSEVFVLRFNTDPQANPYQIEFNGETLYNQDLRYSYPGSTHFERLRAVVFGVEQRF